MTCLRIRSSLVVICRVPGTPVTANANVDSPEINPSILRHNGIRGAANEAVLN
jgi:hypothetical protein